MNKASPANMRKALVVVDEFRKAGILFIPMPVLNNKDKDDLAKEACCRLDIIEKGCQNKN